MNNLCLNGIEFKVGYHKCLTRIRSSVQVWHRSLFFFFGELKKKKGFWCGALFCTEKKKKSVLVENKRDQRSNF
jgi:hypothetical protein